jgi:hypothetical protein
MKMPHNTASLSPIDVKRLCTDLLGAKLGVRVESLAQSADGGLMKIYAPNAQQQAIPCT